MVTNSGYITLNNFKLYLEGEQILGKTGGFTQGESLSRTINIYGMEGSNEVTVSVTDEGFDVYVYPKSINIEYKDGQSFRFNVQA